jgi:hypothetical protein
MLREEECSPCTVLWSGNWQAAVLADHGPRIVICGEDPNRRTCVYLGIGIRSMFLMLLLCPEYDHAASVLDDDQTSGMSSLSISLSPENSEPREYTFCANSGSPSQSLYEFILIPTEKSKSNLFFFSITMISYRNQSFLLFLF